MQRIFTLSVALAAIFFCTAGAKKPVIDLRIHTEGMAAEAPTFSFPATLLGGQEVYLARMPLITQREVRAIYPFPAKDGSQGVYLKLDSHGSGLLQQHTMVRRGGLLVVLLNGKQISNLLVEQPVTDGIVCIPRGLGEEEIAILTTAFPVLGQEDKKRK